MSKTLVTELEARVEALRQALAEADHQLQWRTTLFETNAQISQIISTSSNLKTLNRRIVDTLKTELGLYQAGLFLADKAGHWLTLTEVASGKGNRQMKKQHARLALDEQTSVGWAGRNRKPFLSYATDGNGRGPEQTKTLLLPAARSELALPLLTEGQLVGVLDLQSHREYAFDPNDIETLQSLIAPIAHAIERIQVHTQTTPTDRTNLFHQISTAFEADLDVDTIMNTALGFIDSLGASRGEFYFGDDSGQNHFHASPPEPDRMLHPPINDLALKTGRSILVVDGKTDERGGPELEGSVICAPLIIPGHDTDPRGTITFFHPQPNRFSETDLNLLEALAHQSALALRGAALFVDVESGLQETQLVLETSQKLLKTLDLDDVYQVLKESFLATDIDRFVLYGCDKLDPYNVPQEGRTLVIGDQDPARQEEGKDERFAIPDYPILYNLARDKETVIISNIPHSDRLNEAEKEFLQQHGATSIVIIPLVVRNHVIGLVSIEQRAQRTFRPREIAIYRTLAGQATIGIENARQVERTATALSETQSLYRAGRVLASTENLQETLEEALIEFLYSLNLDQGGITLLNQSRTEGQLMAYVEGGILQDVEKLRFPIDAENITYQDILLSGQPFISYDIANDDRLVDFHSFNTEEPTKSLLEAPLILHGETIGWIGADAVQEHREFNQREIDLARAMADQIAIAIQSHQLLEQTQRRAEQFKIVAEVGEAISGLIELDEVLNKTVNLIRDRFNYYHASIFLLDQAREWAVVRASTGEVGKIMVERPHRLRVGSTSIVGYATANAKPRIALDVGQDAVHFDNPLLPDTRSEMALPLISRGTVIGAVDVQSIESGAFDDEDIAILQVLADQLATAIENAQLFAKTQRRLMEQAILYSIGSRVAATLDLQEVTETLVTETAEALSVAKCALTLLEEDNTFYTINDYVSEKSSFPHHKGQRFQEEEAFILTKVLKSKQEFTLHLADSSEEEEENPALGYLKKHGGTALTVVPVLLRNQVIAFLEIYDDKPDRRFSQEDISLLDSIALQTANALENTRLFESAQESLARTQSLYRISNALTTGSDMQATFETALGEYLRLLDIPHGSLTLFDPSLECTVAQARYINHEPMTPRLIIPIEQDLVFDRLQEKKEPLVLEEEETHLLVTEGWESRGEGKVWSMLFIPLIVQGEVVGSMVADAPERGYLFSQDDIEVGIAIADQLAIWLENRQLLEEAQHRTNLLQTAAEVSRAASSILDEDTLINTSVNLIRDHFDFYYVGLFLVEQLADGAWALLRAGTGEAGRIQIEKGHKLKVGGESMIGWSVENRQARIALDVGEEAVWFNNPYLPDTHSEMALPLITRDEVVGALTVQSIERGAFSDEDVALLQTMADQIANALGNARLFEEVAQARQEAETRLQETQALQELSQALAATLNTGEIIDVFFLACTNIIGFDYILFSQVDPAQKQIKAVTGIGVPEEYIRRSQYALDSDNIMADVIRTGETELITGWDERFDIGLYEATGQANWGMRLFIPVTLRQENIGLVETGFNQNIEATITDSQVRLLRAFIDQVALALDNAQRYEASRRAARREEIIREVTGKIRGSVNVDDILQTTVLELSKLVGASQGGIQLTVDQEQ